MFNAFADGGDYSRAFEAEGHVGGSADAQACEVLVEHPQRHQYIPQVEAGSADRDLHLPSSGLSPGQRRQPKLIENSEGTHGDLVGTGRLFESDLAPRLGETSQTGHMPLACSKRDLVLVS